MYINNRKIFPQDMIDCLHYILRRLEKNEYDLGLRYYNFVNEHFGGPSFSEQFLKERHIERINQQIHHYMELRDKSEFFPVFKEYMDYQGKIFKDFIVYSFKKDQTAGELAMRLINQYHNYNFTKEDFQ